MVLCSQLALWFDVPENRLRTGNAVHLGPGDTVLSDCQKNETKTLRTSAWLWLYSHHLSRRGSDHRMLSYWSQKSLVPVSAGHLLNPHITSLLWVCFLICKVGINPALHALPGLWISNKMNENTRRVITEMSRGKKTAPLTKDETASLVSLAKVTWIFM